MLVVDLTGAFERGAARLELDGRLARVGSVPRLGCALRFDETICGDASGRSRNFTEGRDAESRRGLAVLV